MTTPKKSSSHIDTFNLDTLSEQINDIQLKLKIITCELNFIQTRLSVITDIKTTVQTTKNRKICWFHQTFGNSAKQCTCKKS